MKRYLILFCLLPTLVQAQAIIVPSPVPALTANCVLQYNASSGLLECNAISAVAQPLTDAVGLIADNITPTKILALQLSGLSVGTRTWTIADANITFPSTIASLAANTFTGLLTANGGIAATTGTFSSTLGVTGTLTGAAVTLSGLLTVNAFGSHNFSASSAGANLIKVRNSLAGTGNYSGFNIGNDLSSGRVEMFLTSSTYTPASYFLADGLIMSSLGAGGMSIVTDSGTLRFYTSTTQRARFDATGHFIPHADNTYNLGQTAGSNLRWKDIFAVTKTSVLDVSWGSKSVLVSVLEGPEYRLYDSGTATLDVVGQATIILDPHFVEVVNLTVPYQVVTSGASVRNKTLLGFSLRGQPNESVDWMISATRAGFENIRWRDRGTEVKEPLGLSDPWDARNRKDSRNNTATEPARRTAEDLPSFTTSEEGMAIIALKSSSSTDAASILGISLVNATRAQIRIAVRRLTAVRCAELQKITNIVGLPCRVEVVP